MASPILNENITTYLNNIIPPRDEILAEMEAYAKTNKFPIVGPLVGQFLTQYTMLVKPKRIVELGSGYGYSAIWFARASDVDCKIYCTDGDPKNKELALKYFKRASVDKKIQFLVGDAVESLAGLTGDFDIIYIDIDKHGYPEAFNSAVPRLKKGGLIITDNTLWGGRVALDDTPDDNVAGVKEYARLAFSDPRVFSMVIPIRDGLTISIKL